jgi:sirohydrochlorin ferrochelatase
MTGILLLAHGSREGDTEKTMRQITAHVKAELRDGIIEEAYLQFRGKSLERGLFSLVNQGADDIKVIPYFLFEGVHIKEDIPAEIGEFRKICPNVRITMGRTLGTDKRLAAIVVDRIKEII